MHMGYSGDDSQLDVVGLVRLVRRRGWSAGLLAIVVALEWSIPFHAGQETAKALSLALSAFIAGDLAWTGMKKAYRWLRRKIIVIDLTDEGKPTRRE